MSACAHCQSLCVRCRKFRSGDRIELNLAGIMNLGRLMIGRGTVLGQVKDKGRLFLHVHWDGYSVRHVARISPTQVQKLYGGFL